MIKWINRLAIASAIISVGLALFGLFFPMFYGMISATPEQAASTTTLIERLSLYGVFLSALWAMLLGVLLFMVPAWRNIRMATSVLVTSLVTPPVYYVLHTLVATWLG